jgi:hypothetical protein
MKQSLLSLSALALTLGVASAATIAGSDFSDSAVFNAAGGAYDNSIGSTDDLDPTDNVTVSDWTFTGTGALAVLDGNAQVAMPSDNVTKLNGDAQSKPAVGASAAGLASHSFSIIIAPGFQVDLTSATWEFRKATGSANVRWLAFNTSEDGGNLIYSELGNARPAVQLADVDLTGAQYQGLTGIVTFNWYAGGEGSGDIDFDTPVINGTVSPIPEPSSTLLIGLAGLATLIRRRS